MIDLKKISKYSKACHDSIHHMYDGTLPYYDTHVVMVVDIAKEFIEVLPESDRDFAIGASMCHDLIEDAHQSYSDILNVAGEDVADIVLAVSDIPAENRLLRQLNTFPKLLRDYRAIFVKLCDTGANAKYGKGLGNKMYKKYQQEWSYKRFIFEKATKWYPQYNRNRLRELFEFLDNIHKNI